MTHRLPDQHTAPLDISDFMIVDDFFGVDAENLVTVPDEEAYHIAEENRRNTEYVNSFFQDDQPLLLPQWAESLVGRKIA